MQPRPLQNLWFGVSFVLSIYLLVFFVPEQIEAHFQTGVAPRALAPKKIKNEIAVAPPPGATAAPDIIRIKSSGEEAVLEDSSLSDSDVDGWLAEKKELVKRRYEELFNESPSPVASYSFHVPEGIRDMVDYWVAVFGKYGRDQYILSHAEDISIVYSVLDLSSVTPEEYGVSAGKLDEIKDKLLTEEKKRVRASLKDLAEKIDSRVPLNAEERRIIRLFGKSRGVSLAAAAEAENMRVQEGFADRYRVALALSGQYMDEMERIFISKGLPVELTRIPFVESAFNIRALSSAGARGMWQFIESTGKLYLKVDSIADERLDPILSTYAAAEHLKNDYDQLGSWPLAINAYNTGAGRILKAMNQLNTTDIATIIKKFEDSSYQFYSRNYYPEFLAAVHVYEKRQEYFGDVKRQAPVRYDLVFPPREVNVDELAARLNVAPEVMAKLNPALDETVLSGRKNLPAGYVLKVPHSLGRSFEVAMRRATPHYASYGGSAPKGESRWHMVEEGDTLEALSLRYGVSPDEIEKANNLLPRERISRGRVLAIPAGEGVGMVMNPPVSEEGEARENEPFTN